MMLYFAPLEGITTSIYRNVHKAYFGGCDAYFAPFIVPSEEERVSRKGLRDVLPEKNAGQNLKVQVLSNQPEAILKFSDKIKAYGYDELNLNVGCPYPGVVNKGRGAALLAEPDKLDRLLYEIFEKAESQISVKTRSGFFSGTELDGLMEIYNKYPLSLLIIHPRAREEFYAGEPDEEAFCRAYDAAKAPLCYNGNICSVSDFLKKKENFPQLDSMMIGRGAIKNPALFREIKGGKPLSTEDLLGFSQLLLERYHEELGSETYTLQKMKEVWAHMMENFPEEKKIEKRLKKASKIKDFQAALEELPTL